MRVYMTIWRRQRSISRFRHIHRLSTYADALKDEGDWCYSSEWWGPSGGRSVFRSLSDRGNGVVSVVAYPSSRPNADYLLREEIWLQQRYAKVHPSCGHNEQLKILGSEWRVLCFNDDTRQSTVKLMAGYRESDPSSVFHIPRAHCLAAPYLKSLISAGFTTLASCNYKLAEVARGERIMRVLCIGHGGGSLPLFLASEIKGAVVDIVEIDPLVIEASTKAMGFPSFSVMTSSGKRARPKPDLIDEAMWEGTHERLFLYESDAESFIINSTNLYDMVFIDAYDGDDIFPRKLWDPDSPFLRALGDRLHPEHGTTVVNLHSDFNDHDPVLPMGKYVSKVCHAYTDVLLGKRNHCNEKIGFGLGFTVDVPHVCNTSLVVSRGYIGSRDSVLEKIMSKCFEVEKALKLPFSCIEYLYNRDRFNLIE